MGNGIHTPHGTVMVSGGAATLWRQSPVLGWVALVWPDEEPALESILRRYTATPSRAGEMHGPYLYFKTEER